LGPGRALTAAAACDAVRFGPTARGPPPEEHAGEALVGVAPGPQHKIKPAGPTRLAGFLLQAHLSLSDIAAVFTAQGIQHAVLVVVVAEKEVEPLINLPLVRAGAEESLEPGHGLRLPNPLAREATAAKLAFLEAHL